MTIVWIIGSGGLVGRTLLRAIVNGNTCSYVPKARFVWNEQLELEKQFKTAVGEFALLSKGFDNWEIYWTAGVGTMGSTPDMLGPETAALNYLLERLSESLVLMKKHGALCIASSAGAIYACAGDTVITENTPVSPTTPYAYEKLRQELLLKSFSNNHVNVRSVAARISTIYGAGQAHGKPQGLLTNIARNILRNVPIKIYVPYDTARDYIAVEDAANSLLNTMRVGRMQNAFIYKIIASEQSTTVAEIISIFKRVSHRPPRVITSVSTLSSLYSRRVQFRSVVGNGIGEAPRKSLLVGVSQLLASEQANFASASLR